MSRNKYHIRSTPSIVVPDNGVQTREQKIQTLQGKVHQAEILHHQKALIDEHNQQLQKERNRQREIEKLKAIPTIKVVEVKAEPKPSIAQPSRGIVQRLNLQSPLPTPTKGPLLKSRAKQVPPSHVQEEVVISNQTFTKKTSSKK